MRGADLLMRTLERQGVHTCFANPGTSEMHLVAAMDAAPGLRAVLTLHENVASGAADGWARMTGRPACTMLHLGPGLANAMANLHNARRAGVPLVNVVGEHATYHVANDPPLASDIAAMAGTVSGWVQTATSPGTLGADAEGAVRAALGPPAAVATLIVPADVAWGEVADAGAGIGEPSVSASAAPATPAAGRAPDARAVTSVARALRSGERALILLGGRALAPDLVERLARVAAATGAAIFCTPFTARLRRGAGTVALERLPYFPEQVAQLLSDVRHLVLVDAPAPAAFFAYPGQSTDLVAPGCTVHALVAAGDDAAATLDALVDACGAALSEPRRVSSAVPALPHGALTPAVLGQVIAAVLPDEAIVVDEAVTNRFPCLVATAGARPHDWCCITGGALGFGMPAALGAALGAPARRVVNLQADGSAMYALPALWSMAREGAPVTTVLLRNGRYRILDRELQRMHLTGITRGATLTDIATPAIGYMQLAEAMGVPATWVDDASGLAAALRESFATEGPMLIEARLAE